MIVTAVLTPILTAWIYRKVQKEKAANTMTDMFVEDSAVVAVYEPAKPAA